MKESRTTKAILNAKYNLLFLIINIVIAFFSRKVFIDCLGTQFLGLSSTLQSLLSFLSLAELGIGTAIGVSLYKPLADDDKKSINEIVSVLGYYYRNIGLFILIVGVIISFFLPYIFEGEEISYVVVYLTFYAFLISTLVTYFLNYRQTLLSSDQKNYVVTKYIQTANVAKLLIQMVVAYLTSNVYAWIIIELLFGFLACIILNLRINKTYPWLVSKVSIGKEKKSNYTHIKSYTKQLFIQKVAGFTANQISPLLIFSFVSLDMVTCATNYTTLLSKLTMFSNSIFFSTDAAIGNLIVSKDKNSIVDVYKEMFSMYFFLAIFFSYMLFFMMEPFIGLWLGKQFILGKIVLLLYVINFFVCQYTGATWQFLNGYGLFKDVWASISEMGIYLLFALLGGYLWGLEGILLAAALSKVSIHVFWKPYFLFTQGFCVSIWIYVKMLIRHLCVYSFILLLCEPLRIMLLIEFDDWTSWIINSVILFIVFLVIAFPILYLTIPQFKSLFERVKFLIKIR